MSWTQNFVCTKILDWTFLKAIGATQKLPSD